MNDLTLVTFYTPDYSGHVDRLKKRCDELGLKIFLFAREPLEDWGRTTSLSAGAMLEAMERVDSPILWIDADADLKHVPNIGNTTADVLAPKRDMPLLNRKWMVTSILINPTPWGKIFLRRWAKNSERTTNELCTDDYFFNRTCREIGSPLDIRPLDDSFFVNKLSGNAGKVHARGMKRRKIGAWWSRTPKPGNFGDILTPFMIDQELGVPPEWRSPGPGVIQGSGSTIRLAKGGKVWGSGIMHYKDNIDRSNKLLAVRGPVTQERCRALGIEPPEIVGDPGLLLPMFYDKPVRKEFSIGIVPHYVNYNTAIQMFRCFNKIRVINPIRGDIRHVVDEMRGCESIISSSLHGLIVAHAYHIPYAWVKFKEPLDTDGSKFHDFFESVGEDFSKYKQVDVSCSDDIGKGQLVNPVSLKEMDHFMNLWDVCPFRLDNL